MNLKHWLFLALLAALIASPTVNAQKQRGRTSRRTAITGAAAESWKTFLPAFTAAVKNRDRAYLRKVMVKDFTYTFGDSADDQDEAFRFFDDRNNYDGKTGWQVLQEILAKGAVPDVENMRTGSKRPTYIAPPRAGTGCRSSWEFYGGSWHWMYFVCGD